MSRSVAILGLGLIGGSLLRRLGAAGQLGYDADPETRDAARAAGFTVADTVAEAVRMADLVIVAVPLPAMPGLLAEVGKAARPGTLLTDMASVKGPVAELVAGPVRFVGGHPMAGTEKSGFAAADPQLFDGAVWVLCLEEETDLAGWLELAALVTSIGARVLPTTSEAHDAAVARISHLPHLLAAALTQVADEPLARSLAAGSFRDGTRVAGTRPELSTAMCRGNRNALRLALAEAVQKLTEAGEALDRDDLEPFFRAGYDLRSSWPVADTEPVTLDPTSATLRTELLALGGTGGWLTSVGNGSLEGRRPRP
jgi:prephenate dehydrogenase